MINVTHSPVMDNLSAFSFFMNLILLSIMKPLRALVTISYLGRCFRNSDFVEVSLIYNPIDDSLNPHNAEVLSYKT